jgi:hypothetical protein
MRRFGKPSLLCVLPLLALAAPGPSRRPPGGKGEEKAGAKAVPLGSVHSTSRQKGLKLIDQGKGDEAFPNQMRVLFERSIRMGASNVFLARGDDLKAAVKATWEVFRYGRSASGPVSADRRSRSERYWLVAYLGVDGSVPPAWLVKSVKVSGRTIRLAFTKRGDATGVLHPYFVWAPLGKLGPGTYTLELFDEESKQVTLSRRVALPGE